LFAPQLHAFAHSQGCHESLARTHLSLQLGGCRRLRHPSGLSRGGGRRPSSSSGRRARDSHRSRAHGQARQAYQELQRQATQEERERADGLHLSRTRPAQDDSGSNAYSKTSEPTPAFPDGRSDPQADPGTNESALKSTDEGANESADKSAIKFYTLERPLTDLPPLFRGPKSARVVLTDGFGGCARGL
jgi:hypothetical protein